MNELPTKCVELRADDPNAQRLIDAAIKGLVFEWEGELWNVWKLDSRDDTVTADLQLAATVEFIDPPAWCSCGKPAVRGGLCATEPAAPAIDYRDLLIRYVALVRSKAWEEHPAFPGGRVMNRPHFTDEERTALADIGDESRERYP